MEHGRTEAKGLFERSLGEIERIIGIVAFHHGLNVSEREDLGSYVMHKLIEDDYRRLRRFRGESRLSTYLNVVVRRLYLDFRTQQWGKWRPSAQARSIGPTAVWLEQALYRDGLEQNEARSQLAARGARLDEDAFDTLVRELPYRPKRRFVPLASTDDTAVGRGTSSLSEAERKLSSRQCQTALTNAARELSDEDRLVVQLRYVDECSIKEIACALGLTERAANARVSRIHRVLRTLLEKRGFDGDAARTIWSHGILFDAQAALGTSRSAVRRPVAREAWGSA